MYAYVISPLSDKIRLVVASGGGPMLKYIVTEDDFRYVTTTMNKGEQLTYVLILANANKRGIQKLELAYERKCCVQLCGFTSVPVPMTLVFTFWVAVLALVLVGNGGDYRGCPR